jgi:hypothetical protein
MSQFSISHPIYSTDSSLLEHSWDEEMGGGAVRKSVHVPTNISDHTYHSSGSEKKNPPQDNKERDEINDWDS